MVGFCGNRLTDEQENSNQFSPLELAPKRQTELGKLSRDFAECYFVQEKRAVITFAVVRSLVHCQCCTGVGCTVFSWLARGLLCRKYFLLLCCVAF